MELRSSSKPNGGDEPSRRWWLLMPLTVLPFASWYLSRQRELPDPAENGTGSLVTIVLFSDNGQRIKNVQVRKLVKANEEWRHELSAEPFAVTRQQATEFAFRNKYWNNHKAGLYRCICCGNALFSSTTKFDSDTGWPSFSDPVAPENIYLKTDNSQGLSRSEVLCRKCDAHLGHLFNDGPPPTHNRYCMNSAALGFIAT